MLHTHTYTNCWVYDGASRILTVMVRYMKGHPRHVTNCWVYDGGPHTDTNWWVYDGAPAHGHKVVGIGWGTPHTE